MSGSNPGPVFMALVAVVFSFFVAWIAAEGAGSINRRQPRDQRDSNLPHSWFSASLALGYRANHPDGTPGFQYDSQTTGHL